ncbi:MAG: thioredoxin family protein [Halolamina sp.]|uniref:thioredoxin family protein n=1 Tax=Halolamina sp. TaxID=1940283 RepID=UPI002FC39BA7
MGENPAGSTEQSAAPAREITDEETFDRVVDSEERVLVEFYADWCGPCQMMTPTVEELATETEGAVVKVNVEELSLVAFRYDVESIPTFLGIHDGDVIGRRTGVQEKQELEPLLY